MRLVHEDVECRGRDSRAELFVFGDIHIGKRNCAEGAVRKQIQEVIRRSKMPGRVVRVLIGGDTMNAINPSDVRRFDFEDLADWFVVLTKEEMKEMVEDGLKAAEVIKAKLSNMVEQEINHAVELFRPIAHLIIGAIYGNHEQQLKKKHYIDVHRIFCKRLGIRDLTDQACIRLRFKRAKRAVSLVKVYIRHGYGGGRTPGAEPNKVARMRAEWEWADICFTGHTHDYCMAPPKPVLYVPNKGPLPDKLFQRYRFAANWGCWLLSHMVGSGSYESGSCYEAKPMMTVKAVIWPFRRVYTRGKMFEQVKIELRQYPIL